MICEDRYLRIRMLIGEEAFERLRSARVAVFGLGGVGGYTAEALARSGVGAIDLIDHDTVDITNLNRQIIATEQTLGRKKTEVMAERIAGIDPEIRVRVWDVFYLPGAEDVPDLRDYDYAADAIDTVTGKLFLIENAVRAGTPVISSMGTGNKLDPSALRVGDIYGTSVCPLAKVMRRELRRRGIGSLKCVWSDEEPRKPALEEGPKRDSGRPAPASCAFVPPAAGLLMASEIVKDLAGIR